jgi:hypothetical protein
MYKILRNIIPKELILDTCEYIENISLQNPYIESQDDHGGYVFKRLYHNQLMQSEKIKNVLFYEPLIQKIKKEIGEFCFINDVRGLLNSYGSKLHRDGQSFGFSSDGLKKSSKVIKILIYFYNKSADIPKGNGLDINFIDLKLKNFFINRKIYMKLNFFYEFYLRSRIMQTLQLGLGDVVLMDNNTWHRATLNLLRPKDKNNFEIKKILLDYEIVTDKKFALEYANHVKKNFKESNNGFGQNDLNLLDNFYLNKFKKNGIDIINIQ